VVEFDSNGKAISLEEKPLHPRSHYAVPGLYFYDSKVVPMAKALEPSPRGEIEITDLNRIYLEKGELNVQAMGRGTAWLDAGTHESLLQASNFIQAVEDRQGIMISCPEEIAYRMGYITRDQLKDAAQKYISNSYGTYLQQIIETL
jgi:glucose-1-phosphate thymidylyltransferase